MRNYFLIFVLLANSLGLGSPVTEDDKKQAAEIDTELGALPVIFSTPETGLALGGVAIYVPSSFAKKAEPVITGLMYTEKKQFLWALGTRQSLPDSSIDYVVYAEILDFPQKFYGIGDETKQDDEQVIKEQRVLGQGGFIFPVTQNWGLGVQIKWRDDSFELVDQRSSTIDPRGLVGFHGGKQLGFGVSLEKETTDDPFYPEGGYRMQFAHWRFDEGLGSRYPFNYSLIHTRLYQKLSKRWTLASRFFLKAYSGEVPFYQLAKLGGHDLLRGYFKGRYRDTALSVFETEGRYRFHKRFSFVTFAGAGNVAESISDLVKNDVLPSFGGGVRYQITAKQKINLRADIGVGRHGPQFYLYVLEAF